MTLFIYILLGILLISGWSLLAMAGEADRGR